MGESEFLTAVKLMLGIVYTDALKDAEIQIYVDAAKEEFAKAGVSRKINQSQDVVAVATYIKIMQQSDPSAIQTNPFLINYIGQNRGCENADSTT